MLAKAAELPFPTPPLCAAAGVVFIFNREPVFNNTGNIIGGNFQSTMAGEFAFSISLTLAILYLAVAVRGLRTGKHRALAAVLFALAGLCHLIPAFFVLGCTAALFLVHPDRKRFKWLVTMVPVAGLLTAFWVLPFLLRSDYVNDMGWERLPLPSGEVTSVSYYLFPGALRYLFILAGIGVLLSLVRRYSVGLVLGLAWAGVALAFWHMPQARLWNARLLPFMYLSTALLAAIGVGEFLRIVAAAASGDVRRPLRVVSVTGAILAGCGALLYAGPADPGAVPRPGHPRDRHRRRHQGREDPLVVGAVLHHGREPGARLVADRLLGPREEGGRPGGLRRPRLHGRVHLGRLAGVQAPDPDHGGHRRGSPLRLRPSRSGSTTSTVKAATARRWR